MSDWIRARIEGGSTSPEQDPGPDLERAADLAEGLGCTAREALDMVIADQERKRATGGQQVPPGHAGAGTQAPPQGPDDMDRIIRRRAGRAI